MAFKDITHLRERQDWIENATRLVCPFCRGIVATQMNVLMDKIDELSQLPEKLQEMEKDQDFPTKEDRRGYGVACIDLRVLRDRIGKGNFDFPRSDPAPRVGIENAFSGISDCSASLYEYVIAGKDGKVITHGSTEEEAWLNFTHDSNIEECKNKGYRCVRVSITPIL